MAEATVATPATDEASRASDAALAELRQQLQREREEKEAYKRRAEQHATRADAVQKERDEAWRRISTEVDQRYQAEEQRIDAELQASEAAAQGLEQQYARLLQEGEYVQAAAAQRKLASEQVRFDLATRAKTGLEQAKAQMKAQAEDQARVAAERARDPLAIYSAATRQWIEAHPQFTTDKVYKARVLLAHEKAVSAGKAVDSPDYFKFIEDDIAAPATRTTQLQQTQEQIRAAQQQAQPDAALSEAAVTDPPETEADETGDEAITIVEDEDETVVIGGAQEDATDMYEQAVREQQQEQRVQQQQQQRPVVKPKPQPSKAGAAAPPSRATGTPTTARATQPQRMSLTKEEAERALDSYPPGEIDPQTRKPVVYEIDGEKRVIASKTDAFKMYWDMKQKLLADHKMGPGVR